jgi:hypothetical protein
VAMRRVVARMLRCGEVLLHQRPAAAAVHELAVVHLVAAADGPAREVDHLLARMRALVRAGRLSPSVRSLVAARRLATCMRRAVVSRRARVCRMAHVMPKIDVPVTRPCPRHRREGRRLRRGRRGFGHRLLGRRRGLVRTRLLGGRGCLLGWRLLRSPGRRE